MVRRTRRRILQFGLPTIALLAGCSSTKDGRPTTSSEPSETQTPTSSEAPELLPSQLSIESTVLAQMTAETPLKLESTIRNEGEQAVQLLPGGHGGRALDYLPRLTNGNAELVLLPDTNRVGTSDGLAIEPVEGCWRFVTRDGDPATRMVVSTSHPITIEAGSRYTVTHEAYQDAPSSACFPEGTYEADVSVEGGWPEADVSFVMNTTYTLEIDTDNVAEVNIATAVE